MAAKKWGPLPMKRAPNEYRCRLLATTPTYIATARVHHTTATCIDDIKTPAIVGDRSITMLLLAIVFDFFGFGFFIGQNRKSLSLVY